MLNDDREAFRIDAKRRILVLGGLHGAFLSLIGFRLFYLQIMKGGEYRMLAENNSISIRPLTAPRGRIFDRFGEVLVENIPDYRLVVIPELSDDLKGLIRRLGRLLKMEEAEIRENLKRVPRQRAFLPLKVKSHLDWEEVSKVEARIHDFPGAEVEVQSMRHYPFGALGAHTLGYLGEVSKKDIKERPDIRYRPGDFAGKTGMERRLEPVLRGREGMREVEVNALGREVRERKRRTPEPGHDLYLTLDAALQREAEAALGEKAGAVVALDPNSGEVLALASTPSYDPNLFVRGISSKDWRKLINNPKRPMNHKAIQGQYPPGSTFKIVVALAGLAEGVIDQDTTFYCNGHIKRAGRKYHCWRSRRGHGRVNLVQALEQSCDVYFYRVGEKIGIDAIERQARILGLGDLTGIGLENEARGLMPNSRWKKAVKGMVWFPGETLISSIGQGYNLTTPLQLANMIAAIANGGTIYRPTLVRETRRGDAASDKAFQPSVMKFSRLNEEHLALVREGLRAVLHGERGTARFHKVKGVESAGKTGTAQVVRQEHDESGKLVEEEGEVEERFKDHALFVSYAPFDNPEIAIAVVVEHGGHGSSAAAPVAKKVLNRFFARRRAAKDGGKA